ncbi:hypothetical protein [Nonomuraea salmonea]|uniref:hypothetical protein n=1 Tax=Nonomuraea salmonea TaxID=46181 RepID=UPI002FECD74A
MTVSTQAPAVPAGTVSRALAPDLARGAMLLAIAFAHAPLFIDGTSKSPPLAGVITDVFHFLFVNNHARPLFAFLFGYSLVQLLDRRLARGAGWVGGAQAAAPPRLVAGGVRAGAHGAAGPDRHPGRLRRDRPHPGPPCCAARTGRCCGRPGSRWCPPRC